MSQITFICCYNDEKQLNDMLLQSLKTTLGGINSNIILIDSKQRGYKSAAQAYNNTIRENWEEIGDIIIFCHQDIAFDNTSFIDHIIKELSNEPLQIIGFAGITEQRCVFSNLKYRKTNEFITKNRIDSKADKIKVESVDECCFATTKEVIQRVAFDESNCPNWHLYAADFCYNAHLLNISTYVIPDIIYHKENGESGLYTDAQFLKTMWLLTRKYHKKFTYIYTPCYICPTKPYKAFLRLTKTAIKNYLGR